MTRLPDWNTMLHSLVLIRIGQELGTDSQLSRAVHDVATLVIGIFK
jgi:hypothetical protein